MRAARFPGNGRIELVEVPTPEPAEGELLIRVEGCGICGSDHKVLLNGLKSTPGHEVAGAVVETGANCRTEVGARIAAYLPKHCGECEFCRQGKENLCPNKAGLIGWSCDGGYAEYMLLPDRNALSLDADTSFAEGVVLLDTLGTAGHAIRLAQCWEARSALVIGAGPIGLGALLSMTALGVPQVFVSELSEYRREAAAQFGAVALDPVHENLEERIRDEFPYGVDLVVEAAGSLPTIWQSLDLVKPGGKVCLVGEYWGRVELERPKGSWMINDITAIRSFYFPVPDFDENQRMVLEGRLLARSLVSHEFPLARISEAFDAFFSGSTLKVIVKP